MLQMGVLILNFSLMVDDDGEKKYDTKESRKYESSHSIQFPFGYHYQPTYKHQELLKPQPSRAGLSPAHPQKSRR
jgi:hypothetical protein